MQSQFTADEFTPEQIAALARVLREQVRIVDAWGIDSDREAGQIVLDAVVAAIADGLADDSLIGQVYRGLHEQDRPS